ncbi:hypothetical protein ABVT39_020483 [Epinephelus coioides]
MSNFTYLGRNISSTGDVEKDVRTRICKAAEVFQRLRNVWSSKAITTAIKLRLYMSVVIPTATYACERWMRTASVTNMLDVFHKQCLRTILRISWRDRITNDKEAVTCISGFDEVISNMLLPPMTGFKERGNEH